ncbi:MAG: hypothetical protein HOH74_01220, partial [Gemmatimonadetes bacterium]|nr:hypothetical protein [Gemmatimonadota bacterium]
MARNARFLLVSQNPRVRTDVAGALQTRQREVVDVRDAEALPTLLDRGAALVVVDAGLPDRTIRKLVEQLAHRREVPVVVLAEDSAAAWDRASRGSPLERVLTGPFDAQLLSQTATDLIER